MLEVQVLLVGCRVMVTCPRPIFVVQGFQHVLQHGILCSTAKHHAYALPQDVHEVSTETGANLPNQEFDLMRHNNHVMKTFDDTPGRGWNPYSVPR